MKKVIAAIDTTASGRVVLNAAVALARPLGATVEAIHVKENGQETASRTAHAGHVRFRVLDGDVVAGIVAASEAPDVVAVAVGSRAAASRHRQAGHVTLGVVSSVAKPVLVVPSDMRQPARLNKLLVPLDADMRTSKAIAGTMELLGDHRFDIVVLHVLDVSSLPRYDDQPQHETPAWRDEFVRRYCAWSAQVGAPVERRVGVPAAEIPEVARALDADLVLVGWSRDLSDGHAAVVRELLSQGRISVLLVPVAADDRALTTVARHADR